MDTRYFPHSWYALIGSIVIKIIQHKAQHCLLGLTLAPSFIIMERPDLGTERAISVRCERNTKDKLHNEVHVVE